MARAEGQPLTGELRMGVIPTIAPFLLPAMLPRLRAAMAAPEAVPARGDQPGGLRRAPPRPARLRAARDALRLRRRRFRRPVRRPRCSSPSRAAKRRPAPRSRPRAIDENRLLLLEDGHCLKDHALAACNRPELRAEATMMGTSLHTLVQMVDNGLGADLRPADGDRRRASSTARGSIARPLDADHGSAGSRWSGAGRARARRSSGCSPTRCARSPARSAGATRRLSRLRSALAIGSTLSGSAAGRSGRRSSPWSRP